MSETELRCGLCGQPVRVVSDREGTCHYEGVSEQAGENWRFIEAIAPFAKARDCAKCPLCGGQPCRGVCFSAAEVLEYVAARSEGKEGTP